MVADRRFTDVWHRFWFREGELRPLAIFRVGWSVAVLIVAMTDIPRAPMYDASHFHWPLWDGFEPVDSGTFLALLGATGLGAALALAGFFSRLGAALVVGCQGFLLASDLLLFRNHIYLVCLLGLLLCCSPCERVFSVAAVLRRRRAPDEPVRRRGSLTAVQVIKLQILLVYSWAIINKLRGSFLDGWVLGHELADAFPRSLVGSWLGGQREVVMRSFAMQPAMAVLSWIVVITEVFVMVGLVWHPLRRPALAAGLMLHLGIALTMNVFAFSLLMVASYPLFWGNEFYSPVVGSGEDGADAMALATKSTSNSRTPVPAPDPP